LTDFFYSIDVWLFRFCNDTLSNSAFDRFFPFITEVKHWYIAYIIVLAITFFKGGRAGKITVLTSLILIAVSDQISSSLIKNLVERVRPCNALENVNILAGCTGSFSFPSSHAVNNFAIAVFYSSFFKKYRTLLFIVASLVAFSRIYVGVHYPSDAIGGAIIGSGIGFLFVFILRFLGEKLPIMNIHKKP
jgi:undecaprenyl-diphosphatase